jgi:putative endonuclease
LNATGRVGEDVAAFHLERRGYAILARNYAVRGGEIDIIARDGEYIVFVEVKRRKNGAFGLPRECLTPAQTARIKRAALVYATDLPSEQPYRFDVIEVLDELHGECAVNHIIGAFW